MTRFITLIFSLFIMLQASLAWAADPFTVVGLPVDATANSAIEAQTMAIQDGQVRAAKILLERLTLENERAAKPLPEMTPETVGRMIRALEINNEKRSANRYLGDISVAFNPREVQSYLRGLDLTLMSSQARSRLIVPIGSDSFAEGFAVNRFGHALTPLTPSGMVEVSTPDETRLQGLAAQYGTQQILLVEELGGRGVSATVTDMALDAGTKRSFTVTGASSSADLADKIVARLERDWKAASTTSAQADVTSVVSVLYDNHAEWLRLQQAINTAAQIKDARLDALSKDGALMTVTYGGDMSKLQTELRYKGVDVRDDPKLGLVFARTGRF
ncbi:hypothetical protein ACJ3XI_02665 [Litorimonas sp. RW-G-Af-16]|uniref:hypothetical protein n=1 Tax=Litorimonas sp. RW-G-Af-16 TaxID=3241168 RepID=UPI00390CD915